MTGTKPKRNSALWPWLKKHVDVNLAIALFSLALIAYIWTAAITDGRAERDEAIAAAVKQNSNLAVAYEEHMIRTLNGLDAVTRFVRHEYQRLGARMDLDKYISDGVIDRRIFSILSGERRNSGGVQQPLLIIPCHHSFRSSDLPLILHPRTESCWNRVP